MEHFPNASEVENLQEEDALKYTSNVVSLLNTKSNIQNEEILSDIVSRLSNFYFDYQDFLQPICETLIKSEVNKKANEIFKHLIQSNKVQTECFENLLNTLINLTDFSPSFSSNILSTPLFNSLIDFCLDDQCLGTFSDDLKRRSCLSDVLNVVHNVTRSPENVMSHKADTFKKLLCTFIKTDSSDRLGILSVLTLSYVIEENEANLLEGGLDVIGSLINKIKTVNPVNRKSNGFSVKELLNGLRCISANDSMKKKIYSENGVPLLLDILDNSSEDDEKELALRIFWNLSFNDEIKDYLKSKHKIKNVIEKFEKHENKKIRENCAGIQWELKEEKVNTTSLRSARYSDKGNTFKFDVFLSYSREYKDIIIKIRESIALSNMKVWIDDEQMFGSTIEAMATGIESSRIFIIAMSKAYKNSPNCRCEAEYAFKLKKPIVPVVLQLSYKPTNWLGFIVGNKMYYEFSERRDPEVTMRDILNSIRHIMKQEGNGDCESEDEECGGNSSKVVQRIGSRKSTGNSAARVQLVRWSKADVSRWLTDSKLANYKKAFSDIDGSLLSVLIDLRVQSPEYLNHTLKNEFRMKFVDVLKFHKAMNSLIDIP